MISEKISSTLKVIKEKLKPMKEPWLIVGSVSLAAQGMDLTPRDIDIFTTEHGAYELEKLLGNAVFDKIKFVENERWGNKISSHWGKAKINAVEVDISGDFRVNGKSLREFDKKIDLKVGGVVLPFSTVEDVYEGNKRMGRIEKAEIIKKFLESKR